MPALERDPGGIRAAIVAGGLVTPIASGLDEFEKALRESRQRLVPAPFDAVPPRGRRIAPSKTDAEHGRASQLAVAACEQVFDARSLSDLDRMSLVLIVSTIAGDSGDAEKAYEAFVSFHYRDPSVRDAAIAFPNGSVGRAIAQRFSLTGPRFSVTNACASGNVALGLALEILRRRHARLVLVVGAEVVKRSMLWGAERAGFLGSGLRPFHPERDGTLLGEGAGALLLQGIGPGEECEPMGWLEGYGCACDRGAAAITLPEDGDGLRRAMQIALHDAGRRTGEVSYVSAHAPGTRLIDLAESRAINSLFEGAPPIVNATKALTGHLSGASAIVEAIGVLLQQRGGFLHGNPGLERENAEIECPHVVGSAPRVMEVGVSLSNACGGGGVNTSVVLAPGRLPTRAFHERFDETQVVVTGIGCALPWWRGTVPQGPATVKERYANADVHPYCDESFRYFNRAARLAAIAGVAAAGDARIGAVAPTDVLVVGGTWLGGSVEASRVLSERLATDPRLIRPSMSLDHGVHLGPSLVVRQLGLNGSTECFAGMRLSGSHALFAGRLAIHSRRAHVVVVVGFDALDDVSVAALSWCMPGLALCEGAVALVLETLDHAIARGAEVRAIIRRCSIEGSPSAARQLPPRNSDAPFAMAADPLVPLAHAVANRTPLTLESYVPDEGRIVTEVAPWAAG